ncbi:MAG: hypothetical protein ACTSQD_09955 [Promethearchaeota archaeon]
MTSYDMCIWCENSEEQPEEVDSETGDPSYKDADTANWEEYKCEVCGCVFRVGTKIVTFHQIMKKGERSMKV